MAAKTLQPVQRVQVTRDAVNETLEAIREFGSHGWEILVLWLGTIVGSDATISNVFIPTQHPVSSEEGVGYFVEGNALFQLNRHLSETGLRLIAQVHSHPQEAYHSAADDRYAIVTTEGGFSLVVPNFGRNAADPTKWAIYRLVGGQWRELSSVEARTVLTVVQKS
jgi:hypothetical protein